MIQSDLKHINLIAIVHVLVFVILASRFVLQ